MKLVVKWALAVIGLALAAATALPLVRTDAWWVRIFDFPRAQIAAGLVLVLGGYVLLRWRIRFRRWDYVVPALVVTALAWQLRSMAPYTPLVARQLLASDLEDGPGRVSVLVFNVLFSNEDVAAVIELIREREPDMVLLTEPTELWQTELEVLRDEYPHTVLQTEENHYGMMLYSRLELIDPEVRYLIEKDIPSIRTRVRLRSGAEIVFYGVHPRPPGLEHEATEDREDSDKRDAELVVVAREVAELDSSVPVIVAGDFNDVAWSRTTHLFQRIGGLLDPRVGRGMFNTFDAKNPVLRYPLDHVFVSDDFRLVTLERLPDLGSDHFPMLVVLDHDPGAEAIQDAPEKKPDDAEAATEAIEEVREE